MIGGKIFTGTPAERHETVLSELRAPDEEGLLMEVHVLHLEFQCLRNA